MSDPKTPYDDQERRCPKLGHQITFGYCRRENHRLPCPKTLDCWFELIPVERELREILTPEQWQQAFHRPAAPKMTSLLDLIAQAQKTTQKDPKKGPETKDPE